MRSLNPTLLSILFLLLACALGPAQPGRAADAPAGISFNRDIRPILSDKCFFCHGPDRNTRKADLRLDDREAAIKAGAFEPGKPDDSALIERIFSDDPTLMMPPPKSNKSLSAAQKDLLKKWIGSGAAYQPHWSLIPVPPQVTVPAPADRSEWIRNPIDAFVLERLRTAKTDPAEEAPREKWLRRVTFDLTGLAPTIPEIDAFLADHSAGACEKVVDRLLASPAFGERMGSEWLDAARYADTFGYQADRDMHVWPWRDWVIHSFNANLPFDRFIVEQTAGDLLPGATREQQLATAFNRLHRQTNEGGSIEEEFRIAYIADRVNTNATAFLGLTFECARCHDHKFDPLSQQDFYRLSAFFANIDEHGLYSHFTETAPTPALLLYEGDQEVRHRDLLARIREKEAALGRVREGARARFAAAGAGAADPPPIEPGKTFSFEDVKASGDFKPTAGKAGMGLEFGGDDAYVCKGAGYFGRTTPFTLALWVKPGQHKPRMIVLHQSVAAEDSAFRGLSLTLDEGRPTVSLVHFWPGNAIRVQGEGIVPPGEWTQLAVTYDGSSRAAGVRIYVNGIPVAQEVVRDRLTRDISYRKEIGDYVQLPVEIALGARFRDVGFEKGAIDEFVSFDRALTALEVARRAGIAIKPNDEQKFEQYLARSDEPYRAALDELQSLRRDENELATSVRQIMVLSESRKPRSTHVLHRGAYDAPGEEVGPGTPASVFPFPADWPRNRLGLSRWLTDDRNPLVARVTVNRFWQMFFGRGLVVTSEDFGSQGELPTHPELLDWLAREFLQGWNVKALCRVIVLSATYRQSSVPHEAKLYADDPDNRLLARGPRHRLAAEQIRDNALAVSGLLAGVVGGPSVMPYQPAGLWEEAGTGKQYRQAHGEGLYRRSLYTFWRRTSPPPSLMTFDATTREVCIARRERTATPLQALVLLNDPQFVEAARVLASRLMRQQPSPSERIATAFRLLTSRRPTGKELDVLKRLHDEQRTHFLSAPESAKSLLSVGEAPRDERLDVAEHAALTVLVESLMSFDECVMKR